MVVRPKTGVQTASFLILDKWNFSFFLSKSAMSIPGFSPICRTVVSSHCKTKNPPAIDGSVSTVVRGRPARSILSLCRRSCSYRMVGEGRNDHRATARSHAYKKSLHPRYDFIRGIVGTRYCTGVEAMLPKRKEIDCGSVFRPVKLGPHRGS